MKAGRKAEYHGKHSSPLVLRNPIQPKTLVALLTVAAARKTGASLLPAANNSLRNQLPKRSIA